jgi:hypothetical protein
MTNRRTGQVIGIKDRQQPIPEEKCRAILNKKGIIYSDAEIIQIRDHLYRTAATAWNDYQANNRQNPLIQTAA